MLKRFLAAAVCLLMLLASGCEFFPLPSGSAAPTATAPAVSGTTAVTSSPAEASATPAPTDAPTDTPTSSPTGEPTEEPEPTPSPDPKEGMIFPDSGTKLLMWKDLIALDAEKLDRARNEIFARRGYKFTKQSYTDYFSKFNWYEVDPDFSQSKFSETESANIHLIQAAERAIKGLLIEISSGTKLDYDQDGTLETLTFTGDDTHMHLKMKDGGTTTPWDIECDTPSKKVYLGDIDFKDGKLDLFVDEFGPSSDYAVYVSGVKHKSFLKRTPSDTLPGQISQLKLDGKGKISTTKRMDILMTWFCKVSYKLDSAGKIIFSPQSSYSMGNFKVKTKVALPLKKTASSTSSVLLTVPAGAEVQLVSTDDKKWIKIKAPAGTGWLQMATLTMLADPNIAGWDAFDGLSMAD